MKINNLTLSNLFLILLTITTLLCALKPTSGNHTKPVVIGYVAGFRGLVDTDKINASKLTHINYAFVDIKNGEAFLTNEKTDSTNFRKLNLLKTVNPDLKILISIGGWAWSENFSDAVLTDSSRAIFAKTAVAIIKRYHLDGVDIDWEFPGREGQEGNIYRDSDKEGYTLMFAAIRKELDTLEKITHQKYLLTTAVGGFAEYLEHTEMDKAASYLDYVNLMTYDLFYDSVAVNHSGLYESKFYKSDRNADHCVKSFIAAGVPAEKLVLGLPFYGHAFVVDSKTTSGIGEKFVHRGKSKGYTFIKDSLLTNNNFKALRDTAAKVPYLVNQATGEVVSYDDEASVKLKCQYVKDNQMAGVMFWEYGSDPKEYLLDAILESLK